jgi:predicted metalloprotease with PDZ domain
MGIGSSKVGGVLTVANVVEGSPAWKAGLSPKDELIALDGLKLPAEEFERRLDEYEPGDRVRFTLFRSGALREVPVLLGAKENVTWVIRKSKTPTAGEKRIYESWLGNPWEAPKKK